MANSTSPLDSTRKAIASLNNYDRLAVATWLTGTANPKHQYLVDLPDYDKLSSKLTDICELSEVLLPQAKISLAIEILSQPGLLGEYGGDCDIDSLP